MIFTVLGAEYRREKEEISAIFCVRLCSQDGKILHQFDNRQLGLNR